MASFWERAALDRGRILQASWRMDGDRMGEELSVSEVIEVVYRLLVRSGDYRAIARL